MQGANRQGERGVLEGNGTYKQETGREKVITLVCGWVHVLLRCELLIRWGLHPEDLVIQEANLPCLLPSVSANWDSFSLPLS